MGDTKTMFTTKKTHSWFCQKVIWLSHDILLEMLRTRSY